MLEPFFIVAIREILAGMCATTFFTAVRAVDRRNRLNHQIVELESLDQVRVPDQRGVVDVQVIALCPEVVQLIDTLLQVW